MNFFKKYYAVLTGLLVFLIYLITLAPSVVEIDSGELATVQSTLGIAHPTGYPLFTMVGYLFSLIPMPFAKIYQLNLLAAFWSSAGAGIFAYLVKFILENISALNFVKAGNIKNEIKKPKKRTDAKSSAIQPRKNINEEIPELKKYLAAVLSALLLALERTFWSQSTSVEVYSLQVFLFLLIILFTLKAFLKNDDPARINLKNSWLPVAFLLALGFSNHMTTLFLLPGIAYLYFYKYRFNKKSFLGIGIMLALFFPVLILIYSYLPIRAAQKPVLNWGNTITLDRLLRHIEGNQYHVWLFSSTEAAAKQLKYFISNLLNEFGASLFICLFGIFTAYKRAKKIFVFGIITFVFTVLYAINYNIHDIDSYFLLAYIMLALFGIFGIVRIFSLLKAQKHNYLLPAGMILIFLIVQVFLNYPGVNKRDAFTFEDYTKNILRYSGKNSVILSYEWDHFVSPSYYFQYVEKYRPDVTVVDKELLRRSWYYDQLNRNHPALFAGMQNDVRAFQNAVAPFESGGNFDPGLLESSYRKVMTDIVGTNIDGRDVYIAPELFDNEMQRGEFSLPAGYTLVPELFNFKVVKTNGYITAPNPDFEIRFPSRRDAYTSFIENSVGSMLARRALYEMQFDKIDRAKIYIRKLRKDFPDYILPQGLSEVLER